MDRSLCKILGPRPQDLCTPDTVCRNGAQTHQTGFTILCYSATIYQWMSAVSGIVVQSLTLAAIRGPRLKLLFVDFFAWQNLHRIFSGDISKKMICSKFLAACHSGAPFQPGALRTCVQCLMVNPALSFTVQLGDRAYSDLHCVYETDVVDQSRRDRRAATRHHS